LDLGTSGVFLFCIRGKEIYLWGKRIYIINNIMPIVSKYLMKILLHIVFLFPAPIFAQVELHNVSLIDSNLKILYFYVNNRIQIVGLNNYSNIKLVSANGKEYSYDAKLNCFFVNDCKKGHDTLTLFQNDIPISTSVFECKKIPSPIAGIGNSISTSLTVDEILNDPTLNAILPDCYLKPYYTIVSYQVSFWRHRSGKVIRDLDKSDFKVKLIYKKVNDSIEEISIKHFRDTVYYAENKEPYGIEKMKIFKGSFEDINFSSPLKNYQVHIIKQLKTGDQIIFENIKCTCPNCVTLNLGTLFITIK
jgi:hypothetical protein